MDAADYKNVESDKSTNPTKTVKVNVLLTYAAVSQIVLSPNQGTNNCYGCNR